MISIIAGGKGTGKTKRVIKLANEDVVNSKGNIVFVDDDKRHIYDLKHDLRFISMDEYPVKTKDCFIGFLCGIISNDYDIGKIYIDGLLKVMDSKIEEMPKFVEQVEELSKKYGIEFVMTISCTQDLLDEKMHKFLI